MTQYLAGEKALIRFLLALRRQTVAFAGSCRRIKNGVGMQKVPEEQGSHPLRAGDPDPLKKKKRPPKVE